MFCNKCGTEVSENDKFCKSCGNVLSVDKNDYNISDIVDKYGKDRISAIKYLMSISDFKLTEAKNIVDDEYNKRNGNKLSFWEKVKLDAEEINQKKQEEKERLKGLDKDKIPYCPKCHSTQLSANKRGFGFGKAVVGGTLTFGVGVLAGGLGANKIRLTCMNCGYTFKPGRK